jgi:hypothetical protein
MVPFHLTILLPGAITAQPLLIWADRQAINDNNEIHFYDEVENLVAIVPAAIVQITPAPESTDPAK